MKFFSRRRLTQFFFALLANANGATFWQKGLYRGSLKGVCFPGLNCYSCPLALFACPLGSLQQALASFKALGWQAFSALSYVLGYFFLYGLLLGRIICGWVCPFGLLQELLFRIPSPKKVLPSFLKYFKYVALFLLVLFLPLFWVGATGYGKVWFCRLVCPAGTLEAGIFNLLLRPELRALVKGLFFLKLSFLGLIILLCVFYFRFFCVVLCPLGLIYGFFNRISLVKLNWRGEDCLNCGLCRKVCPLNLKIPEEINGCECIRCLNCLKACPTHGIGINLSLTPAGKFDLHTTFVKSEVCAKTEGHRTNSDRLK